MINKPLNPYPYNESVTVGANIAFTLNLPPNQTFDRAFYSLRNINGDIVDILDEKYDSLNPENIFESKYVLENEDEYYWNLFYLKTPSNTEIEAKHKVIQKATGEEGIENGKFKGSTSISLEIPDLTIYKDWNKESDEQTIPSTCGTYYSTWRDYSGDLYKTLLSYDGEPCINICSTRDNKYGSNITRAINELGAENCILRLSYEDTNSEEKVFIGYTTVLAAETDVIIIGRNDISLSQFDNIPVHPYDNFYNSIIYQIYYKSSSAVIEDNSILKIDDDDEYYRIDNWEINGENLDINIYPGLKKDIEIGKTVAILNSSEIDFNSSPDYYFRAKKAPNINIYQGEAKGSIQSAIDDIGYPFNIEYKDYSSPLNYFKFQLIDPSKNYAILEESPLLFGIDNSYKFNSLSPGRVYIIKAICIDMDGDEYEFEREYTVGSLLINPSVYEITLPNFNSKTYSVDIDLSWVDKVYRGAYCDIYRRIKNAPTMEYAGGGIFKTLITDESNNYVNGVMVYTTFIDYNISNNKDYEYIARIEYGGKNIDEEGKDVSVEYINLGSVRTDFCGECLIGLTKKSDNECEISETFIIDKFLSTYNGEYTQELTRDYIGAFGKYPQELKGSQEFVSGNINGILGTLDKTNGRVEYKEHPSNKKWLSLRESWLSFINDDTLKLYKDLNGNSMFISINSSRIKPYHFGNAGLVNEVEASYRQIGSTSGIAIYDIIKQE